MERPTSDRDVWRLFARCRGTDLSLFFATPGDPAGLASPYATARALCTACPVVDACRRACDVEERGLSRPEGFRAGETPAQRIARRRGPQVTTREMAGTAAR
jgi:hypothetical protein